MKRVILAILGTLAVIGIVATFTDTIALAQFEGGLENGIQNARGADQPTELFSGDGTDLIGRITTLLLFIVGVISVFMLIIGGLKFVLSGGDKAKTTAARNTIVYAIIGLLVAFFSYAIIDFIFQAISGGGLGSGSESGYRGVF